MKVQGLRSRVSALYLSLCTPSSLAFPTPRPRSTRARAANFTTMRICEGRVNLAVPAVRHSEFTGALSRGSAFCPRRTMCDVLATHVRQALSAIDALPSDPEFANWSYKWRTCWCRAVLQSQPCGRTTLNPGERRPRTSPGTMAREILPRRATRSRTAPTICLHKNPSRTEKWRGLSWLSIPFAPGTITARAVDARAYSRWPPFSRSVKNVCDRGDIIVFPRGRDITHRANVPLHRVRSTVMRARDSAIDGGVLCRLLVAPAIVFRAGDRQSRLEDFWAVDRGGWTTSRANPRESGAARALTRLFRGAPLRLSSSPAHLSPHDQLTSIPTSTNASYLSSLATRGAFRSNDLDSRAGAFFPERSLGTLPAPLSAHPRRLRTFSRLRRPPR